MATGIALFVVLSMCLQVPVFENYYFCLGYVVMAVYCWCFGTLSGTIVGVFGVILYCVVISGLRGMPGWALGNVVIGIAMGACFKATRPMKSQGLRLILHAVILTAACAVGILLVKSLTESVLYLQPMAVRIGKNFSAFVADAVMLILSLPVCLALEKPACAIFPGLTITAKPV